MRQFIVLVAVGIVGGAHAADATTLELPSTRDTSLVKSFVASPQLIQSSDLTLRGATAGAADARSKPLRPQAAGAAQAHRTAARFYAMQPPAAPAQARGWLVSSPAQSTAFATAARFRSGSAGDPAVARRIGHPASDLASRDAGGVAKSVTARDPAKAGLTSAPSRSVALATLAQIASAHDVRSPAADRLKLAPARRIVPVR